MFYLYSHLLLASLPALDGLQIWWQWDIPDLDADDWDDICYFPFRLLVSLCEGLIRYKFKITHRAYFTPYRLHKMQSSHLLECWHCRDPLGGFFHIFWACPAVSGLWMEVLAIINTFISVPLQSYNSHRG